MPQLSRTLEAPVAGIALRYVFEGEIERIRQCTLAPNDELPGLPSLSLRRHDELTSTANLAVDVPLCSALLRSSKTTPPLATDTKKAHRSELKSLILLEARTGIEPMYTALQAVQPPALARVSGPLPLRLPLFLRRVMPLFSAFCKRPALLGELDEYQVALREQCRPVSRKEPRRIRASAGNGEDRPGQATMLSQTLTKSALRDA